jgi:hypothetical protein
VILSSGWFSLLMSLLCFGCWWLASSLVVLLVSSMLVLLFLCSFD